MMQDIEILKDVLLIDNSRYQSSGDYSATDLIAPPRLVCLKKRYRDHLIVPVERRIDTLIGTALHTLFETNLAEYNKINPRYTLEEELTHEFNIDGVKRIVSGRYDVLHGFDMETTDIKTAKVWKLVFDPDLIEWTEQQNIYAHLLALDGRKVNAINVLIVYKDWSEFEMIRSRVTNKVYPREPIERRQLDLWPLSKQNDYIRDRLRLHIECEDLPDEELPLCTSEEMWERFPDGKDAQYALFKKKSAKRATKILHDANSLPEAIQMASDINGVSSSSYIEIRHPVRKRCVKFCPCNDFCNIYQRYKSQVKNLDSGINEIYSMEGVL